MGRLSILLAITVALFAASAGAQDAPPPEAPTPTPEAEPERAPNEAQREHIAALSDRAARELDREELSSAELTLDEAARLLPRRRAEGRPDPLRRRIARLKGRLVAAFCARALDQLAQGRHGAAQVTLDRAAEIQESIEAVDPRAAELAADPIVEARGAVRRTSQDRALAQAERAESVGQYRRAVALYGEAAELGADVDARIRHIYSLRLDPLLAVAMSAVVPGSGQLYSDRELPAALFFIGVAASVVSGIVLAASADSRYDQYLAATNGSDAARLYDGVRERWAFAITLLSVGGALYIWNLVDSFLGAKAWNSEHLEE